MAPRPRRPAGIVSDSASAFAALGAAVAKLQEDPKLRDEMLLLSPLYAAAEALLLGAAGGVDRGRDALDRAVAELSGAGVASLGPRVTVARACREIGEQVAVWCHTALTNASALDPEGAAAESTPAPLRENARRLAVLLLTVSACRTAPRRLVRMAKAAIDRVLVDGTSLEPWQVLLRGTFKRPPWAQRGDVTHIHPPTDPRKATRDVLDRLLARADDAPQAFRTPSDDQFRRAVGMMRTLRIRPDHPGGGWVTPFGAAKRFAQCFDCDTFPRKETEARPRPRRRRSTSNGASK
jgi:hypothetical protein